MKKVGVYGAYGYTGQLITEKLVEEGFSPLLAGRSQEKLAPVLEKFGCGGTVFSLNETEKLTDWLSQCDLVIHCAGPFSKTALPMVQACLQTQTHYLDITGEWQIFEEISNLDEKAKEQGIMLMPGVGFDVVPSDCLAAHLHSRMPEATHLELAFTSSGGTSRGTQKTMTESMGKGTVIRKDGRIVPEKMGKDAKTIDFGERKVVCASIPWGDVSTAFHSTGIPNIVVYTGVGKKGLRQFKLANFLGPVLRSGWMQKLLMKRIDKGKPGPSAKRRAKSQTWLWGKVSDGNQNLVSLLKTPGGYSLTANSAVHIAKKVLNNDFKTGFQTPSRGYGKDLILELEGCERQDL